jgi:paraquat-inducible protein A
MKRIFSEELTVCPDCDLLVKAIPVKPGEKICCPRCSRTLRAPVAGSAEKTMALSLTGLLLFMPSIFMPLLSLDILGLESTGSIFTSAKALLESGFVFTGIAVFITSILVPLVKLFLIFLVSMQVSMKRSNNTTIYLFKYYKYLDEWGGAYKNT